MNTITTIDQNWLARTNPKEDWSTAKHILDYTTNNGGYATIFQVAHDAIKLGNELNKDAGTDPSKLFTRLESDLSTTISVLPILRLPGTTSAANKSIEDLKVDTGVSFGRKAIDAVRTTSDCIATYFQSAAIFTTHPVIKVSGQITELAANALGIPTAMNDYCKAVAYEEHSTGEVKKAFEHSRDYYFLCFARNMACTISGALGVILYATGAPLLSAIALTVISLAAGIFETMRDVKKEAGKHSIIDMDKEIQVI
jgi:hypothetical protein